MNQETKHLVDYINHELEEQVKQEGWQCGMLKLKTLSAEIQKQDMFDGFEIFCNNLKELFDEEDTIELVEALGSYDYYIVYSVLYKLLNNYLTSADVRSWLSVIRTNDSKSQYLVMDYLSMRFHIQKEQEHE